MLANIECNAYALIINHIKKVYSTNMTVEVKTYPLTLCVSMTIFPVVFNYN